MPVKLLIFIYAFVLYFRQKVLNSLEFAILIGICLLIAIGYGCLHGYTFYPDPNIDFSAYDYIINSTFWKDSEGRLPVFVVAEIVGGLKLEKRSHSQFLEARKTSNFGLCLHNSSIIFV